jgi:hypothetical protein
VDSKGEDAEAISTPATYLESLADPRSALLVQDYPSGLALYSVLTEMYSSGDNGNVNKIQRILQQN